MSGILLNLEHVWLLLYSLKTLIQAKRQEWVNGIVVHCIAECNTQLMKWDDDELVLFLLSLFKWDLKLPLNEELKSLINCNWKYPKIGKHGKKYEWMIYCDKDFEVWQLKYDYGLKSEGHS